MQGGVPFFPFPAGMFGMPMMPPGAAAGAPVQMSAVPAVASHLAPYQSVVSCGVRPGKVAGWAGRGKVEGGAMGGERVAAVD